MKQQFINDLLETVNNNACYQLISVGGASCSRLGGWVIRHCSAAESQQFLDVPSRDHQIYSNFPITRLPLVLHAQ